MMIKGYLIVVHLAPVDLLHLDVWLDHGLRWSYETISNEINIYNKLKIIYIYC